MKFERRQEILQGVMQGSLREKIQGDPRSTVEQFSARHFSEYRSWYCDAQLDRELGPAPDRAWLEHVLRETEGCQLAYERDSNLLAVSGVVYPVPGEPCYTLTDLAVHPEHRGEGLGAEALWATRRFVDVSGSTTWQAFVEAKNLAARAFFASQGWQLDRAEPGGHGMLRYLDG